MDQDCYRKVLRNRLPIQSMPYQFLNNYNLLNEGLKVRSFNSSICNYDACSIQYVSFHTHW